MSRRAADKRFFLHTLGCKVNWCDSDTLVRAAQARGWQQVRVARDAHIAIVNTCTVTAHADATARKIIRALKRANPAAPLIITGCYARTDAAALARVADGLHIVPDATHGATLALMESLVDPHHATADNDVVQTVERAASRTRAFIKIQDGCDQYCAYCKVPLARGAARSVPVRAVRELVRLRAAEGFQEIVLSGVNLAQYNDQGAGLADVVRAVAALDCVPRIRISSVEAHVVNDALMQVFADYPALMPHLHIPLQSGSPRVIERMRRPVSRAQFMAAARAFYACRPDAVITTDVLVGFPGETEEDLADTLAVIDELAFGKVHVFPFSPRPGTMAAGMKPRIAPAEIRARETRVLAAARAAANRCRIRCAALPLHVLIEQQRRGWWEGFSQNYLRVRSRRLGLRPGQIVELTLNAAETQFVEP